MKNLKNLAAMIAMLFCCIAANAQAFEVDGLQYSVTSSIDLTVSVLKGSTKPTGNLVIPATVTYNEKEYRVASIGNYAFEDCNSLTSITLPESVRSIGYGVFYGCSSLTSITIPEGVTSIGQKAFYNCSSLTSITIPTSVVGIGLSAFYDCSSLAAVYISDMTAWCNISFGSYSSNPLFYGKNLYLNGELVTELMIPSTLTFIKAYTFYGCTSITSITIPESVTSFDSNAFCSCSNLVDVYYDGDFESWMQLTFGNDDSRPNRFANNVYLKGELLTDIELPSAMTSIPNCVLKGFSGLTSITIPNSVTSIGAHAFENCSSLAMINIPEGVASIGNNAFNGCTALKELTIENSSSSLSLGNSYVSSNQGRGLFYDCPLETLYVGRDLSYTDKYSPFSDIKSLASVSIGDKVTSLGKYAFSGCSSLASVTMSDALTAIQDYTFLDCSSLASITIPASVTSIKNYAFNGCTALESLIFADGKNDLSLGCNKIGSTLTAGKGLFYDCPLTSLYLGRDLSYADGTPNGYSPFARNSLLTSITIGDDVTTIGNYAFYECTGFESIIMKNSIETIGTYAFYECTGLSSISMGSGLVAIGDYAFEDCRNLLSVTIPENVTSIGYKAFNGGVKEVILKSNMPPVLKSNSLFPFDAEVVIAVPKEVYSDYSTTDYWSDWLGNITIDDADVRVKNLTLKASDDKSSLLAALGEENVKFVTDLTISGSINSYDFMLMRNQMPVLRHLNLKDASIVYNAHEHYTGYHTEDHQFPAYGLSNCKLFSLVFPENIASVGTYGVSGNKYLSEVTLSKGVASIGNYAFYDCDALTAITLPEGVTSIGNYAFQSCGALTNITMPKGLASVGDYAFKDCNKLVSVTFLDGLTSIGQYAFGTCSALEKVVLPPTLKTIEKSAFSSCGKLKEIRIPSSVRTVGDYAFSGCTRLNDVYVYTVEPFSIGQSTFAKSGNQFIGTLHAPKVSYWTYYYNTQWNQFANRAEFDEPYDNFYLVGDKELDSTTGAIEGEGDKNPDAEMGNNSGLIVEDDIVQDLGNVEIEHNGTNGGSIIVGGEGCVNADKLSVRINVTGGKWYFFCFPFDVKREDIILENGADWVFRYYDGEERANNGKGGWKNVTSDGDGNHLKAATGYIFQCSKKDVLILTAKNQKIKQEKKYNELVEHITQNAHDASWNFVGNPYLSYYEVTSDDYSAPITVWDGSKYIAIRPGDDDYQLAPFEAFFVQKPEGVANVDYIPERQMTYHQSQEAAAKARARRRTMPVNPDRLLVNITLGNGTDSDQTRVVFNNEAAMGYETACDAAKFETAGVAQLYTIDSRAVKYAINERPIAEGIVTLGYTAPAEGVYTLAAPRMDTPISIKDNLTGTIHDFAEGSYEFASEAGTFDDRFTVIMKAGETGIDNAEIGNQNSEIYNVKGQRVNEATEQGIYIKDNRKVVIK